MTAYARLRSSLRAVTPDWLAPTLARVENYGRRLKAWVQVLADVRGATPADRAVLWRSALAAPVTSLERLGKWREPFLLADADVIARDLGTFGVRARSDDLGHVLIAREVDLYRVIRELAKPGDLVIDAGANIGAVTVTLARCVGPAGRVIAVEMMPDTAARLRRHIALNGLDNVAVVEKALSARAGEIVRAVAPRGFFGQASIALDGATPDADTVEVETATIDDIVGDAPVVALMKMDLEGAEGPALIGAARTLARTRAVLFECWSETDGIADTLRRAGFAISRVDERNLLARRSGV